MGMGFNALLILVCFGLILAIIPPASIPSDSGLAYNDSITVQANLTKGMRDLTSPQQITLFGTFQFPNPFSIFSGILNIFLSIIAFPTSVLSTFSTIQIGTISLSTILITIFSLTIIIGILIWYRQSDF